MVAFSSLLYTNVGHGYVCSDIFYVKVLREAPYVLSHSHKGIPENHTPKVNAMRTNTGSRSTTKKCFSPNFQVHVNLGNTALQLALPSALSTLGKQCHRKPSKSRGDQSAESQQEHNPLETAKDFLWGKLPCPVQPMACKML